MSDEFVVEDPPNKKFVPEPKLVVDTDFVLEDPPPRKGGNPPNTSKYRAGAYISVAKIVTELRENHPGRWAKVFTGGGEGTKRRKDKYEEEGFDWRMTQRAGETARSLYVRWPG